jgi:NADH dehydrogenase
MLAEVVAINSSSREVILEDGKLDFDFLIVATGAHHAYFGHQEWEAEAPGLKNLDDALEIRRRILLAFEKAEREKEGAKRTALLSFVIVGAGPTGVELAGAIAEISRHVMVGDFRFIDPRKARIVLVEAGPRILSSFPEKLSAKAEESLRALGVEVIKGRSVSSIEPGLVTLDQEQIRAATILWSAGVLASPLAKSLKVPLDRAGRVLVEPDLTVPGHKQIFVIGDLAAFLHQTGKPLPGVAPVAIQQGRHAARNILRACRSKPYESFHYRDRGSLATIGRASAVANFGSLKISGIVAWLVWLFVHIFFLIGFRNRFIVLFEWAWAYITFQRGARLITGDITRDG